MKHLSQLVPMQWNLTKIIREFMLLILTNFMMPSTCLNAGQFFKKVGISHKVLVKMRRFL
jgi:hypothetical protein